MSGHGGAPVIWVSAGELSGDMHAADLVEALHLRCPELSFRGIAGPCLRERCIVRRGFTTDPTVFTSHGTEGGTPGFSELFGIEQLSIMGGTEVLSALPRIFKMWAAIRRDLAVQRPLAVILVDAPDFNFKIAKMAHQLDIPVYYYISPKIWAWRSGRANFLKRHVRRVLSILPFETEFYRGFGMDVPYVGNPLVAAMNLPVLDEVAAVPGRIGLMPGSRKKEINALMPLFARAARLILSVRPDVSFHCIQAPGIETEMLRGLWQSDIPLMLEPAAERYRFMSSCDCILAASGTATLECALAGTPTVVSYKLSALTGFLAARLLNVRFVSLPNLIMNREVFPELLQQKARPELMAEHILHWLNDEQAREKVAADLQEIRRRLGSMSAPEEAARIILNDCFSESPFPA
ncbi:MAG: lipid-A-disaccharide synthase [Desulfovibrionaceae bacterium]|nr:lipid-A-disaccharide synthase [Desulfovibrionaceae bacterium]